MFGSYVYFLTDDHGHIKIGKTNDMLTRMKELQTGNPYKLRILLTVGMRNEQEAFELEQTLHKEFRKARMEGEWFHAEPIVEFLSQDKIEVKNFTFFGRGPEFRKTM